jgi:isopenicillin N synthase-like dioxygenase
MYRRRVDLDVVDLTAPLDRQVETMRRACEELGFFRIPLASVDREVADRAWSEAAAFFALPTEEKAAIGFPEPGYPYGYSPFGFESLAKSTGDETSRADLKESLSAGPDCLSSPAEYAAGSLGVDSFPTASSLTAASSDPAAAWIRSPSLWPEQRPALRSAWEAYFRTLSEVAGRLMSVMALALELPADYFEPLVDRPITSMRAINYPELPASPPEGSLRAGAHSDYGTLTILRTDDVAGLEIQQRDGSWVAVSNDPETFVVNLGDSIAQWTNDRWRSTVHRVALTSSEQRQSFAFFHMANWDAEIECLPTCRDTDKAPHHAPVLAGPWLMSKFQSTVT